MKQYVTISYEGVKLNSVEVLSFIEKLKSIRLGIEDVHVCTMDETEVNSVIIRHTENKDTTELSVAESACIYVKKKFEKFFNSKMKLSLALLEAVNDEPNNEALMNAIKVISSGVNKKLRDSYGISTDVICVFKMVQSNM